VFLNVLASDVNHQRRWDFEDPATSSEVAVVIDDESAASEGPSAVLPEESSTIAV